MKGMTIDEIAAVLSITFSRLHIRDLKEPVLNRFHIKPYMTYLWWKLFGLLIRVGGRRRTAGWRDNRPGFRRILKFPG
jgi:hypothetical protein